jgi:predicted translation initiation factor SUI1
MTKLFEVGMNNQKKLYSLSDLDQLLSDSEAKRIEAKRNMQNSQHDGKGKPVRVLLDKKGRKGKSVTVIVGLQHNPDTKDDIARILKQHCGAGGTVKDGNIEIQGDQREKVTQKLEEMNYVVK